jgi:hypothetical protein
MMLRRFLTITCGVIGLLPATAGVALAQPSPRGYLGASVGSLALSADKADGTSAAAGFLGGFRATPWLDVEGEVAIPSSPFTRSYGDANTLSLSLGPPGGSREELERNGIWLQYDHRREVTATISGVAIFHPPRPARVTPGLIVGVTSHRVQDSTVYTPLRLGPGVDPDNPNARQWTESGARTLGAFTVGANAAIAVTRRLAVVPDLRYDYGSIGDEINNSLRMSVRVLWRF